MKDIVFLVADNDMSQGIKGLLSRLFPEKKLNDFCDIYKEPNRDAGVYKNASDFLRKFLKQYRYAMVFLDLEGSGQEKKTREEIEIEIETQLVYNGWAKENVKVIVFAPELEIWLWVESQIISKKLGWDNYQELKKCLISKGYWEKGITKPKKPKESLKFALKEKGIPFSPSIFKKIAENIPFENFQRCQDASFRKFIETLERWYDKKWI
ncbi:MAG TPA: hypothetical protein PLT82_03795 [Candidatus Hydrogenedens sp.]|nr:hypothetical protein [Candidatus Hydrogenedens sp.]HOK10288.1 hypothetical protein [Candidatus Hydrogenedens sp.]HOL19408.1 hypothetical protein [Candidatus Hydrogenedens sp.]HPP58237.1 hypothetical protein [Candidatus Hydrogenedens sp.]